MTSDDRWYDKSIVAFCDRSYEEQSWRPATKRTINRGTRIQMVCSFVYDRTINRSIVRPIVPSIIATYDRSYDQSWHQTIWNRRLDVLNMTIDLATTDFPLAMTHELCDQSYILSTICPQFQHLSVAGRSYPGRKTGVTEALGVLNMTKTLLRLILPWRSPTTSATSRTFFLYDLPTIPTFFGRTVGRNLLKSLGLKIAITITMTKTASFLLIL